MSDGEKVGTHCYECGQEIDGDVYEGRSAEDWFGTAQAEAQIAEERGKEIERLKEQIAALVPLVSATGFVAGPTWKDVAEAQEATIATLIAERDEAQRGLEGWNELWHCDIRRAFYAEDVAKAAMRAGLEECERLRASLDKVRTERQVSEEYGCAAREEIERLRGLLGEIVLDRSELWPMYSALRSRVAECLGRSK